MCTQTLNQIQRIIPCINYSIPDVRMRCWGFNEIRRVPLIYAIDQPDEQSCCVGCQLMNQIGLLCSLVRAEHDGRYHDSRCCRDECASRPFIHLLEKNLVESKGCGADERQRGHHQLVLVYIAQRPECLRTFHLRSTHWPCFWQHHGHISYYIIYYIRYI